MRTVRGARQAVAVRSRARQKKSLGHFLRTRSIADCQSRKPGRCSPQPSAPEKKCGTFFANPVDCGLSEPQNRLLQSAAERARKKVRDIFCEPSRLRTVRAAKQAVAVRSRARQKKSAGHFLRTQSIADCQSCKPGRCSPQPSVPEKKCGTFLENVVDCGLSEPRLLWIDLTLRTTTTVDGLASESLNFPLHSRKKRVS